MKRIISLGAAFLLMLSAGMTSYAGHHVPCMTRVIQGSGLCRYGESWVGGHHLFGHDGWADCGACGVDVGAVCERWESCHEGYGAGTACPWQGTDVAPESQSPVSAAPGNQPSVSTVPESQSAADQAAGNQAQAQTGSGTGASGTGTYGAGSGSQGYSGTCYGSGDCYSGSYATGHHGSGHHGRGHHEAVRAGIAAGRGSPFYAQARTVELCR